MVCVFIVRPVSAANPPKPAPAPSGNRFLFVVDTSSQMQRLKHGGRQDIFDLLHSGLTAHLRSNDTLGVWTFNQEVYAGQFPMQVWSPEQSTELASKVSLFLKDRKYEKDSQLNTALAKVLALVKGVQDVNVLIIVSGESRLTGNLLDASFQSAWFFKSAEARETKQPVIVALVAQKGQITHYSVTLASEPVGLPIPPPVILAAPPPPAPTNMVTAAKAPSVPPVPPAPKPELIPVDSTPVAQGPPAPIIMEHKPAPIRAAIESPTEPAEERMEPVPAVIPVKKTRSPVIITAANSRKDLASNTEENTQGEPSVQPSQRVAPAAPAEPPLREETSENQAKGQAPSLPSTPAAGVATMVAHAREPGQNPPAQPAMVAAVTQPGSTGNVVFLIAGGVLLACGWVLGWFFHRRQHAQRQFSAITRSMDGLR